MKKKIKKHLYNKKTVIYLYPHLNNKNMSKTFTVSLTFTDMTAENPLEAAKKACDWLLKNNDANAMIYDVIDEETNERFTVDLSEDDENAVLPD